MISYIILCASLDYFAKPLSEDYRTTMMTSGELNETLIVLNKLKKTYIKRKSHDNFVRP